MVFGAVLRAVAKACGIGLGRTFVPEEIGVPQAIPAEAIVGAAEVPPVVSEGDEEQQLLLPPQAQVSSHLLLKIIGHVFGILSMASAGITMPVLATKAVGIIFRSMKDPTFNDVKEAVWSGDWGLGTEAVIAIALAFLAMGPFNWRNTYKFWLSLAPNPNDKRGTFAKTCDRVDLLLMFLASMLCGAPISTMLRMSSEEMLGIKDKRALLALSLVGAFFPGSAIAGCLRGLLTSEINVTIHNVRRGFFPVTRRAEAGLGDMEVRREAMDMLFDGLNSSQLLSHFCLDGIDKIEDNAQFMVALLQNPAPRVKVVGELLMNAFELYVCYYGTRFFKDLGIDNIKYIMETAGVASGNSVVNDFAKATGFTAFLSFLLMWGLLLRDFNRSVLRIFAAGKFSGHPSATWLQKLTNFDTLKELLTHLPAAVSGLALAITNMPFVEKTFQYIACTLGANYVVSLNGVDGGLKDFGFMPATIHDRLVGRLCGLINEVENMTPTQVRDFLQRVQTEQGKLPAAMENQPLVVAAAPAPNP